MGFGGFSYAALRAAEGGKRHKGAGVQGAVVQAGADEAVADHGFVAFVQVGVAVDGVALHKAAQQLNCMQVWWCH